MPSDSRSKRGLSGQQVELNTLLLATLCDGVNLLLWTLTSDGSTKRPSSLVEQLQGKAEKKAELSFRHGKDFDKARQALLKQLQGGENGD